MMPYDRKLKVLREKEEALRKKREEDVQKADYQWYPLKGPNEECDVGPGDDGHK